MKKTDNSGRRDGEPSQATKGMNRRDLILGLAGGAVALTGCCSSVSAS